MAKKKKRNPEKYYKNKGKTHKVIKKNLKKKKHIVHGARALNVHLPSHLDRHTEDWDVFSKTPKKTAKKVERRLDKAFGGDYFYTEPAQHKGTHKIRSHVTKRTVADYTKPEKKVPYITKKGIRYTTLSYFKKHIKGTLRDPASRYRHDKDREVLQRIKIAQKRKGRKMPKKKKPIIGKPKQLKPINLAKVAGIKPKRL